MAGILNKCNLISRFATQRLFQINTRTSAILYSTDHTSTVRKQIENTRKRALEAGGKKRVDKQHEKVGYVLIFVLITLALKIFYTNS